MIDAALLCVGSSELEGLQQRTSAIHDELTAMTPRMCDQFTTLRRDLKDVQRALVDLQRRLPAAITRQDLEPVSHGGDGCGRSTTSSHVRGVDDDSGAGQSCSVGGPSLGLPGAVDHLNAGRLPCVSGPPSDLDRCQNVTHDGDDAVEPTAANVRHDPTGEDPTTAVFTLCL